jgi:hypothetical protein
MLQQQVEAKHSTPILSPMPPYLLQQLVEAAALAELKPKALTQTAEPYSKPHTTKHRTCSNSLWRLPLSQNSVMTAGGRTHTPMNSTTLG